MSQQGPTHRHPHEELKSALLSAGRRERPALEVSRRALSLAARLSPAAAAGVALAAGAAATEAGTCSAAIGVGAAGTTGVASAATTATTSTTVAVGTTAVASGAGVALSGTGSALLGTAAVLGKWLGIGFVSGSVMVTAVHWGTQDGQPSAGSRADVARLEVRGDRSPTRGRSSGESVSQSAASRPDTAQAEASRAAEPRSAVPESGFAAQTAAGGTAYAQRTAAGTSITSASLPPPQLSEEAQATAGTSLGVAASSGSALGKAVAPLPAALSLGKEAAASLGKEMVFIERARVALGRGDARGAQASLRAYRSTFPSGHFIPEAAALDVEARVLQGDAAGGRAAAQRFLDLYPESPLAERVRTLGAP